MSVIKSTVKRANVEILQRGMETKIIVNGNIIDGVKKFYINGGHDRQTSLLIDVMVDTLDLKTKDEILVKKLSLSEITTNDLMEEISKRMVVNVKMKADNS